jgi:hypothetical protein
MFIRTKRIKNRDYFYCSLLNTPTIRSRDGVLPASHLLFSKMQGNEVESVNTPTVRSWEVYLVENRRDGNKISQRVIRYLGTTKPSPSALADIMKIAGKG